MICTKVVIIRGLLSLFAEYFRRITDLFTEFALFVFSSKVIIHPTIKQFFRFLNGLLD